MFELYLYLEFEDGYGCSIKRSKIYEYENDFEPYIEEHGNITLLRVLLDREP